MECTYRPIVAWPGKQTTSRKRGAFKAGYTDTLRLLDRELRHLGARSVVFQVAMDASDIRLDGQPRAGARARHPGVIVSFESKHGPLSYPCDTFSSWEDNVRAIALALEHLRTVDRYGVTKTGEQYRGWSKLPPPIVTPAPMSEDIAYGTLFEFGGGEEITKENLDQIYRRAAMATHPDRGGSAEKFKLVARAKEVLEGIWKQ
jgi:hypothetical protein